MVGPYVAEFQQAWIAMEASVHTKRVSLDLCGVTFVDDAGLKLLGEIHRTTQADVLSDSPLTSHFAEQVTAKAMQNK